jgi:hypothetical protein
VPYAPYPQYGVGAYPYAGASYGAPYGYPYGGVAPASGTPPANPGMSPQQELDFLKNQAQTIEGQLEQIEVRMRELEKKE